MYPAYIYIAGRQTEPNIKTIFSDDFFEELRVKWRYLTPRFYLSTGAMLYVNIYTNPSIISFKCESQA